MEIEKNIEKSANGFRYRDHLANERTFLAWIRTNLGIMAFGFVVEKFSFFLQEIAAFLGHAGLPEASSNRATLQGYSSIFGISLVAIGALLCIFAFIKFKLTGKQIDNQTNKMSNYLDAFLAFFVFFVGVLLIIYLINSNTSILPGSSLK